MPYIPGAHGLTGCDNVAKYLGIGKIIALKSAALQRLSSQLCRGYNQRYTRSHAIGHTICTYMLQSAQL